jgi:Family of unknown function (DUF6459)
MAQAMVEVFLGARPATQLRRWTSDAVYGQIRRRGQLNRVAESHSRRTRAASRVAVRSVRVCEVADGVVEAAAVVDDAVRVRVMALRFERAEGAWRCTFAHQL